MIDGGRVQYHLTGSRGGPAFTDRGQTIDIHDGGRRESVLAALQLSAQKWGTFTVRGNERFQRVCVELAAEHGFRMANPDLQQAIAAEREHLRPTRRPDPPGRQARPQPESMTPAAIYRRHLAEIIQEQPQRRADLLRKEGSTPRSLFEWPLPATPRAPSPKPSARPPVPIDQTEKRDWDAYSERAASYAFSPPGQEMRDRLAGHRQSLIRLEGRQDELDLLRRLGGPLRHL